MPMVHICGIICGINLKYPYYRCECDKGYELAKGTCEDINECLDSPCSDTERCSNVEGEFFPEKDAKKYIVVAMRL